MSRSVARGFMQPNPASGASVGGVVTGATQGSVLFAGASGVLAQDNAELFWDDANDRLGIGTAAPANTLHVVSEDSGVLATFHSAAAGNVAYVQIHNATNGTTSNDGLTVGMNTSNAIVMNRETGALQLGTVGQVRWAIASAGHLTAGTDNTYDIGASGATRPRDLYLAGLCRIGGDLDHDGTNVGFYGTAPTTKQAPTGSRGGNAALASLLTALAAIGLITDSTSA